MQTIERNRCAIGGVCDLEPLYNFVDFPVFMGCTDQDESLDMKADMSWYISKSSGLIQLKHLLPPSVLYPESHGAGEVGALWNLHHKEFAKFIKKFNPKSVFEIGGAHGILEKEYNLTANVNWTILEPNPSPVEGCKAKFIKGFFDEDFKLETNFDTLVHSHVFEHIYEPSTFVQYLANFMAQGKMLIFSLPNMEVMLKRKYTNCINFEHTIFLTEDYVDSLMSKFGFRLVKKEFFKEDHSIFYAWIRNLNSDLIALPDSLYEKNCKIYKEYIDYHLELVVNLNSIMSKHIGPVYLFGAHVFSQYLLKFGLNRELIDAVLDNHPKKCGKRLYGTNLMVQSPDSLLGIKNPAIILRAGVYNNEIKSQILQITNQNAVFL
jgi:hypothetical protein